MPMFKQKDLTMLLSTDSFIERYQGIRDLLITPYNTSEDIIIQVLIILTAPFVTASEIALFALDSISSLLSCLLTPCKLILGMESNPKKEFTHATTCAAVTAVSVVEAVSLELAATAGLISRGVATLFFSAPSTNEKDLPKNKLPEVAYSLAP